MNQEPEVNWLALLCWGGLLLVIAWLWIMAFRNPVRGAILLGLCYAVVVIATFNKKEKGDKR